jgi:hypothetical protein
MEPPHAPVVGVPLSTHVAFLLERLDDLRHGGGPDMLRRRKLAERPRPAEDEDRQRGEARRTETARRVLAPHVAERVDGRRMEAVGGVQH